MSDGSPDVDRELQSQKEVVDVLLSLIVPKTSGF